MPRMQRVQEKWNSRLGVILAVAGSAVGLGNFLRFPGNAAEFGGGAFMIAYFISFLIMGLPICWAEWIMGRYGGQWGFHSCPGILAAIVRRPIGKYLGVIGIVIPIVIYMYYIYIESWCLGYAVNFLAGAVDFPSTEESKAFWERFVGMKANGAAVGVAIHEIGGYLIIAFLLNIFLISRGITKGIEWFCKCAMPLLIVMALVVLVRVLTLGAPDPTAPERNVVNGLGFMWNPTKFVLKDSSSDPPRVVGTFSNQKTLESAKAKLAEANTVWQVRRVSIWKQLKNPELWLAAAGQIFFSLSVGFGIILTYASYLSRKNDIVLSGLAAGSTNEFCEVVLGGLITIPAAFAFLGTVGLVGSGLSTFDLGFKVLPMVFSQMPFGAFFGFLFFFLLFLAAVTTSLSMLQPGVAFLEECLALNRNQSVAIVALVTALGCGFVIYFSADVKALDTLDFWVGTVLIYISATIQIIVFGWVLGVEKGFEAAHRGASIRIPKGFKVVMKYICPLFLLTIFVGWLLLNGFALGSDQLDYHITDLIGKGSQKGHPIAWISVGGILAITGGVAWIVARSKRYHHPF